jgi:hypothetical protein
MRLPVPVAEGGESLAAAATGVKERRLQTSLGMYEADEPVTAAPPDAVALRAVPDLAGIPVEDASGLSVGELFGALVEADTGLLRYIDLSLAAADRHVLVPIGHARVRTDESGSPHFRLRAALIEELQQIPPFPADVAHIDDPFERELLEAYGRSFHGERYYAHPAYDHQGIYAGDHLVVGDGLADDAGALRRLSYLPGWRVAKGEPDIRDWPLLLACANSVRIRDLVVEPAVEKVRYIVVDTPDGAQARLLPIGFLQIEREARVVRADLTAADLAALPAYDGGGVSREQEDRLRTALQRRHAGRRRYALPDYRPDESADSARRPRV